MPSPVQLIEALRQALVVRTGNPMLGELFQIHVVASAVETTCLSFAHLAAIAVGTAVRSTIMISTPSSEHAGKSSGASWGPRLIPTCKSWRGAAFSVTVTSIVRVEENAHGCSNSSGCSAEVYTNLRPGRAAFIAAEGIGFRNFVCTETTPTRNGAGPDVLSSARDRIEHS